MIDNQHPSHEGTVRDEDGTNPQIYQSKDGALALKVAGNFGKKPITVKLSEFINQWKFYDFNPLQMREYISPLKIYVRNIEEEKEGDGDNAPEIGKDGKRILNLLIFFYQNKRECFDLINIKLKYTLGISLEIIEKAPFSTIKVWESESHAVKFSSLSDGTLRIIAYCALLYQDDLPPLIAIEEPERNLHPALLLKLAAILKELSQKTQLIVTTHSSQFLDCFTPEELKEDICLLLLSKSALCGTQVFELDELSAEREDLRDWMENFGIGSAVYHSQLLEEVLEAQYA